MQTFFMSVATAEVDFLDVIICVMTVAIVVFSGINEQRTLIDDVGDVVEVAFWDARIIL